MLNSVLYNNLVSFVAQDHHGTQAVLETTSGLLPFKWPFDGIPHTSVGTLYIFFVFLFINSSLYLVISYVYPQKNM